MDVNLPTDLAEFVDKQVKDGRYQQASDVVSAALRQFRLRVGTGSSAAAALAMGLPQGADIEALAFARNGAPLIVWQSV
jgi:putative addiction module CopG family antidote